MLKMSTLTRNADAVRKNLREEKDGSVWCKKPCSYYLPKRLIGTPLLRPDLNPPQVGAFGMLLMDKTYLVFNACCYFRLGEAEQADVLIDDKEYVEFRFEAGDKVIENLNVPVVNTLGYDITKAFGKKAIQLPWYTEDDQLGILLTLKEFTGVNTPSLAYTNLYLSHFMRSSKDVTIPYRLVKDKANTPFEMIGINLVGVTIDNTLNALGGSYMDDALQGKLLNASERVTPLEQVLTA